MNANQSLLVIESYLAHLNDIIVDLPSTINFNVHFDQQLFMTSNHKLNDYLAEINEHFEQLKTAVQQQKKEHVQYLADKILLQITALQREIATRSLV